MPVRWNMSLPCPFSQNNTFYNTVSLKAFHALHHPRKFSLHWVTTNKHNVHQTNDKDLNVPTIDYAWQIIKEKKLLNLEEKFHNVQSE